MKLFATLATLVSLVVADEWALYCGSSCSDGKLIASGAGYIGAGCTNFDTAYDYCYLVADKPFYKAVVQKGKDCYSPVASAHPGECTSLGPWQSYQLVIYL